MKTTILLQFVCLFVVGTIQAQTARIRRADDYYNNLAYVEASKAYQQVADKTNDSYSIRRLAECYVKLNQTELAEVYYRELVESGDYLPEDLLAYSKVLRSNGQFESAQRYLAQYCTIVPADLFARAYLEGAEKLGTQESHTAAERFIVRAIPENSSYSDFGAAWYENQLLFVSARRISSAVKRTDAWDDEPFLDVFETTPSASGAAAEVSLFPGKINSRFHEGPLTVHPNGQIIYFTRNNYLNHRSGKSEHHVQKLKIYSAQLVNGRFTKIVDLPFNDKEYSTGHPSISADGKWLFFASDIPGGFGGTDIYKIQLDENGSVAGSPINLGNTVNTPGNELFPFIHSSGMLFFSSNGWPGYGGLDVFVCDVSSNGDFIRRSNVGQPANSPQDDFSFILNADQTEGYFSSNRSGGAGSDDIYHFDLLKPFNRFLMQGVITDQRTHNVIPLATLSLFRGDSLVETVQADAAGHYTFAIEPDERYQLRGQQADFFDNAVAFLSAFDNENTEIRQDISLVKDPKLSLYGIVRDKESHALLEGVSVTLTDQQTGEIVQYSTPDAGDFRKILHDKVLDQDIAFNILLSKAGYLGRSIDLSTVIEREGEIVINEELEKISIGLDLAKIVDLEPIYFDYAKFSIRPDAAIELDKIVKVLNDNPEMVVELGAHTDARGSAKANQVLSQKRAQASAEYIKKRIPHPERITAKGYGESVLLNHCSDGVPCSEAEQQLNRRTEFRIINM